LTIELIKYHKKYASGVADMWNKSADAWGGKVAQDTEESIIQKEENSTCLDLTLAKQGDDIIGYCKLSVDHHDEGALYIDLLNVRPDYHGQSVGKKLLLDSIEKTIHRGWRRLDLFTWPGNTKAIPLYKKCGFFWEKRDETTHLINLIPDVLSCELVEDYFKTADWYKDSTRSIEITPDTNLVNDFDLWTYSWEKEGKTLDMTYTRRGRGLRKVETDDFSIEVVVEDLKLVFGDHYKVQYHLKNKTDKPLSIKIKGENDKNIQYDFETDLTLVDSQVLEGSFFVDRIDKKQKEKHTHPVVKSHIEVNGKKATFMTGIEPVFPMNVTFKTQRVSQILNVETPCYIDIENETGVDTSFEFTIEDKPEFSLRDNHFKLDLKKDEKKSIKTYFTLREASLVAEKIKVIAKRQGKKDFEFKRMLRIDLRSDYGKAWCESDDQYTIANGQSVLYLNKENNIVTFCNDVEKLVLPIYAPKLGKPFSQEFEKKLVDQVEITQENDWIQMTCSYSSDDFKGIEFDRIFKLHSNGLLKRWCVFKNNLDIEQTISFADGMFIMPKDIVAPYDGKIISLENEASEYLGYLESNRFDENWLFSSELGYTIGYIWPKTYDMHILGWYPSLEYEVKLPANEEEHVTEVIQAGINAFPDWHRVREYALGRSLEDQATVLASEVLVNGGNPFAEETCSCVYKEHKKVTESGHLSIVKDGIHILGDVDKPLEVKLSSGQNLLSLEHHVDADILRRKRLVYKKGPKAVDQVKTIKEGLDVYRIDNGLVSFECAPGFSPSISSLVYDQVEWLSSAFPHTKSLAWWKSYVGGINMRPVEVTLSTMDEEYRECSFVTKTDNFGNVWSGLEIVTEIRDHKTQKGRQWTQYYLTLPGVPVMTYFADFENSQESYNENRSFFSELFLTLPETPGQAFIQYRDSHGRVQQVLSGSHDRDIIYPGTFEYHLKDQESFLTFYRYCRESVFGFQIGTEFIGSWGRNYFAAESKSTHRILPRFIFFGQERIEDEWIKDFKNIRF